MTEYQIPYICSECSHDRWITANPEDENSKRVKCPKCGYEDTIKLPSQPDRVVHGMDELADYLDEKIND